MLLIAVARWRAAAREGCYIQSYELIGVVAAICRGRARALEVRRVQVKPRGTMAYSDVAVNWRRRYQSM